MKKEVLTSEQVDQEVAQYMASGKPLHDLEREIVPNGSGISPYTGKVIVIPYRECPGKKPKI